MAGRGQRPRPGGQLGLERTRRASRFSKWPLCTVLRSNEVRRDHFKSKLPSEHLFRKLGCETPLWRHLLVRTHICRLLPLPAALQARPGEQQCRATVRAAATPRPDPMRGHSPSRPAAPPPGPAPARPLPAPCASMHSKPPPSSACTRCSVRFNVFLGTGHYFLIPINACDSIYVQDKFISISFFN